MSLKTHNHAAFSAFILGNPLYRKYLLYSSIFLCAGFILFKLLYPSADYFTDSLYYIMVATGDDNGYIRPAGYAFFLKGVHYLFTSSFMLVLIQFLLLQASGLYFFFTILYVFRLPDKIATLLLILIVGNPLSFYAANLVASDCLFTILSLLWMTTLIHIVYKPSWGYIIAHTLLLGYILLVRYNALSYPLVVLTALFLSKMKRSGKVITGVLSVAITVLVIFQLQQHFYRKTGIHQFTNYSGWQTANNALYMYSHVPRRSWEIKGTEARRIHRMVKTFFDTSHVTLTNISPREGSLYMINPAGPLKNYLFTVLTKNPKIPFLKAFSITDVAIGDYGRQLVLQHPWEYIRYYVLPNTMVYLYPPLEQFEYYAEGRTGLFALAAAWFNIEDPQLTCFHPALQQYVLLLAPMLFLILHLLLGASLYMVRPKPAWLVQHPTAARVITLLLVFVLANALFSILASPVVMRYQLFAFTVLLALVTVLINAIPPLRKLLFGMKDT
ncbi:MAG TPA: hypothetical protein VM802_07115 [Chitinophaga sp.]|uniref:hypothetical protein n=1 Tax=Chitinophaga sp. TaxID=1869181 RepID=UPI002D07D366|nr:hypothetical protein [Chitinophaga sp.]HVI44620.1 hypothetical protein [Chitinophaga sp.]